MHLQSKVSKFLAVFLLTTFSASLIPVPTNANNEIYHKFVSHLCPLTTYITVKRNVVSCETGNHIRTEIIAIEEHNTAYTIYKCSDGFGLCIADDECGPDTQHMDQWLPTICE